MSATSSQNLYRFRHGTAAIAIPAYAAQPSLRAILLSWRDSLFIVAYQLAFQLMELARRWNY